MMSWKNKTHDFYDPFENIGTVDRWLRVIVGTALIGSVFMANETPLVLLATLPLAGTYPILTAIIGYDPFYRMAAILMERKPSNRMARTEAEKEVVSKAYSRAA